MLRLTRVIFSTIQLFFIRLLVMCKQVFEIVRLIPFYLKDLYLLKLDALYFMHYLFRSPYKISKYFLFRTGAVDLYSYGDTWPSTVHKIIKQCDIQEKDTLFEIGCGTGKAAFWFQRLARCKVLGNEQITYFITKANHIKKTLGSPQVNFVQEDFSETDYSQASVIYFYGTSFDEALIQSLMNQLNQIKKGTKVISVSFPLLEYAQDKDFKFVKSFFASFPWGKAQLFLQIKS